MESLSSAKQKILKKHQQKPLEYCSFYQALRWIAYGEIPIDEYLSKDLYDFFNEVHVVQSDLLHFKQDLINALSHGKISAKGRFTLQTKEKFKAYGFRKISSYYWRRENLSISLRGAHSLHSSLSIRTKRTLIQAYPIELKVKDLVNVFPQQDITEKNKGGAPVKYPWDEFYLALFKRLMDEKFPKTHGQLIDDMLDWCSRTWNTIPSYNTVKSRTRDFYQHIKHPDGSE